MEEIKVCFFFAISVGRNWFACWSQMKIIRLHLTSHFKYSVQCVLLCNSQLCSDSLLQLGVDLVCVLQLAITVELVFYGNVHFFVNVIELDI